VSTLFDPSTRHALEDRIEALQPDSVRHWGRMSPHQAMCHLSDGFRMALGERMPRPRLTVMSPLLRFVAISMPLRWPHRVKTMPEVEQGVGGTPPVEFDRDRRELLVLIDRLCARSGQQQWPDHPMFGSMRLAHWGRWGYRHLDHHLRQFGV